MHNNYSLCSVISFVVRCFCYHLLYSLIKHSYISTGITAILVNWLMVLECVQCVLKFVTRVTKSVTPSVAPSSVTAGPRRTRVVKLSLKECRVPPVVVKQLLLLKIASHLQQGHLDHPPARRQKKVPDNNHLISKLVLQYEMNSNDILAHV